MIRTLNDRGVETDAPIEVVSWTNEEGSRFQPPMVASGVFAGVFDLNEARAEADIEGRTIAEELARIGYDGPEAVGGRPVRAYFEAHIEQGPILEDEGDTIGVVTGAQGQRWFEVTLTGQEAHAGPTPMPSRRDALIGAARVIPEVRRIGRDFAPDGRSTVGFVQVHPNSRNVIPGRVFLTVDLRHPDDGRLADMEAALEATCRSIADEERLELRLVRNMAFTAQPFDPVFVETVRSAARDLGYAPPGHRQRRRARRGPHGPRCARRHDLHPLRRRHQPRRDRECPPGTPGSRAPTSCCGRCWRRRTKGPDKVARFMTRRQKRLEVDLKMCRCRIF